MIFQTLNILYIAFDFNSIGISIYLFIYIQPQTHTDRHKQNNESPCGSVANN